MRIHTDVDGSVVLAAARQAGATVESFSKHGSRSRKNAFEVQLSGDSRRNGNGKDYKAATWDAWGVFFSVIFDADPNMKCWAYDGQDEFNYKTAYRFDVPGEFPADSHGDHRFRYVGIPGSQVCNRCTAVTRWQ